MKKILPVILVLCSLGVVAQESMPGRIVVCPGSETNSFTRVLSKKNNNLRLSEEYKSNIVVTYNGFEPSAKAAFQYAVDIWRQTIPSEVTINIIANWSELDEGVLGSAGPSNYYRNFERAPHKNMWYPVALAEKLARVELNGPDEADIEANFNSEAQWYFGTDGNTPTGFTDFVSVVLHELGHGLGFTDLMDYDESNGNGSWGYNTNYFSVFDNYIVNDKEEKLTDTQNFSNPSASLGSQLTSGKLYFNSVVSLQENNGQNPHLYSPTKWNSGSSIAHLDEFSYRAGDINSLMSPQIGRAEAIHEPGPLTLAMFAEMGWFYTSIEHVPLADTENLNGQLDFRAIITSDNLINEDEVNLYLTFEDGEEVKEQVITLTKDLETPNLFISSLPYNLTKKTEIFYYFFVKDEYQREFNFPSALREESYSFIVGPDTKAPTIVHTAHTEIFEDQDELEILAEIKDNLGIDSSYVEYRVNEGEIEYVGLEKDPLKDDTFSGQLSFSSSEIKGGDSISYRIVVSDIAATQNIQYEPQSGYYRIAVMDVIEPDTIYVNNFDNVEEARVDFYGRGFDVKNEAGFSSGALHSLHPYMAGGNGNEINYFYYLNKPILVKESYASIQFDEVALIEPGEADAPFGTDGFYDFVVVEGSKDNGTTWIPIGNGYDASDNADWLKHYNDGLDAEQNSTSKGNASLFRKRIFNLHTNFAAGDIIRIRFRLFSDPAATGWGWAIDNLEIQSASDPTAVKESEILNGVNIYPNPATDKVTVNIHAEKPLGKVYIRIFDLKGRVAVVKELAIEGVQAEATINTNTLSKGIYAVEIKADGGKTTKKLIIR
jgi:hypothetical protein